MLIEKRTCYSVIEEPGDGTRYTHMIITDDHTGFEVYRDIFLNGAGLQKPTYISDMNRAKMLSDMTPIQASAWIKDNTGFSDNPWTVASVYRCVYELFKSRLEA